ncbi:MAG TPA: hypothetical protein V6C86_19615 [Oculatellaceae cyanobacterium]
MQHYRLILSAMLVSYAISQMAQAADQPECLLVKQEPVLDTSTPTNTLAVTTDTAAATATATGTATANALYIDSPNKVAMLPPTYSQDNLYKALYGWSSVVTVEFVAPLSTATAKLGDVIETKLVQDFRWGSQLIASKGSLVRGHVVEICSARTLTHSALSTDRTLKQRGRLSVQFDELVDQSGKVWAIKALPSPRQKNSKDVSKSSRRYVECDDEGRIVKAEAGLAGSLKGASNTAKVVTMLPLPGTVLFTTLAPAVAMGAVGAASPSIAYDKPVAATDDHQRAKGAAYGFFSNLPGAFVVKSVVEKGSDIELLPGDQLAVNVHIQDTGYRLPPGRQLSVNGTLLNQKSAPIKRLYPVNPQSNLHPACTNQNPL